MENALLVGLSRQMVLGRELEVVANNIANLNTTGFKADNSVFEEFLMPVARDNDFTGADQRISFVQDRATWHDLTQGSIQRTGNPLDVAIDGNAFLVVQTPRGERYTRNGALQINATGQLVTSEGYQVLGDGGPITLQNTDSDVIISENGTITVREGANTNVDSPRGKLRLAAFEQPQRLQKDGGSTFVAPPGVDPVTARPTTRVMQGALEKSNVRGVVEMTRMIEITRNYNQIANLLQQQSDMRKTSLQQLADVPS
jgi:flagellar basal-body rod protein FlgF/flagellar basal-body rod protein FlgG